MSFRLFVLLFAMSASAQDVPVINPRGVLNAITRTPGLATVGRGAILEINGQNLAPAEGVTAESLPLPTQLGDPPIQVLVNGKPVPLFSATSTRVLVQIPWTATLGASDVVVDRGGITSAPVPFTIAAATPSIRTNNDFDGQTLFLTAAGLGPINKTVAPGAAGPADPPVVPTDTITAYIGGISAAVNAKLSSKRVGEFEVQIDVPPGARPGDVIALAANGTFANFTVFHGISAPDIEFLPLPPGTPQLVTLTDADLDGNYLIAVANSDARGCYAAFLFDMLNKTMSKVSDCLGGGGTGGPLVTLTNSNVFGALAGPPPSSTAMIFNPALGAPLTVNLPAGATSLVVSGSSLAALIPGSPQQRFAIDAQTGAFG